MRVVVIGAGPAGVSVVETLRAHGGGQVDIVVLSAEPHPPYSPPAMANHFLHRSEAHLWRGEDWPERMQVDYRSGTAARAVLPEAHRIELGDGTQLSYDRLVIASGAALHAPLAGIELLGVCNFKSLTAATRLVAAVRAGSLRRAVIVGAGFIGLEIAVLLRQLGVQVVQVELREQVMADLLDGETAAIAQSLLRDQGVDLRLQTEAVAFEGQDRARQVRLASGDCLDGDLFVAATGIRPNIELLAGSGIDHPWGITVNEKLQTSATDVYAAGDVVLATDRLTGERTTLANFPNAVAQGQVVAHNLLGRELSYEGAERLNSLRHIGLPIVAMGRKNGSEVLRAKGQGLLRTLYLEDHRLVGFQLVGEDRLAGPLRTALLEGRDLRGLERRLLDPYLSPAALTWPAAVSAWCG